MYLQVSAGLSTVPSRRGFSWFANSYIVCVTERTGFPLVSDNKFLFLCSLGRGFGHGHDLLLFTCGQHVH